MPIPEKFLQTPVKSAPLSIALGVNSIVICDCGCTHFKVGIAYSPDTGNNFIRVLECTHCMKQMPVTHRSDVSLAPALSGPLG